jgi:hypothetical protein
MNVRSLGCRTDLMLIRWDGMVDEFEGAVRARSPANPDFFFGNFLLFADPLGPGEAPRWARFQAVETAAAFRRRGVCGTLLYHTACVALAELGAQTLVIVGLPDHTSRIYESAGFEPRERLVAAVRRGPPNKSDPCDP